MSQQINLFNPVFLKQKKHFSAYAMVQALGLVLAGALSLAAYTGYQASALRDEAEEASAQLVRAQAQLTRINTELGSRRTNQALEAEIKKTEIEIGAMTQVLEVLQKGELGNTKGYSDYMRAFARQSIDGVWLTGFGIVGAGHEIALQGRALKAELVPAYIGQLQREPILQGKTFSALQIKAPAKTGEAQGTADLPPYLEFSLRSAGLAGSGEQAGAGAK